MSQLDNFMTIIKCINNNPKQAITQSQRITTKTAQTKTTTTTNSYYSKESKKKQYYSTGIMPHCQKEKFDRAAKSKKERSKAKQDATVRKQKIAATKVAAELEAEIANGLKGNNIAPVEGHGEYEIGCEPEPEYHKFNVKKRNKKHLRLDLKKAKAREDKEEEERIKKEQQEEYEKQQLALKKDDDGDSEEEDDEAQISQLEYFVFICECCDRRYATKNQFMNHTNSKKHLRRCRMYEELGLIVTHIELRGENNNEQDIYNDDDDDNDNEESRDVLDDADASSNQATTKSIKYGNDDEEEFEKEVIVEVNDDESEEEYIPRKKQANIFAGFSSDSSSSSSSSSDDDDNQSDDDNDDDDNRQLPHSSTVIKLKDPPPTNNQDDDNDEDNIDFDELIYQNQLIQNEIDAAQKQQQDSEVGEGGTIAIIPPSATSTAPIPFNENYDPTQYDINENRLASVQHRLRKNLAAKGIEPKTTSSSSLSYDPLDAITMGKTLLQQVLESNVDELQHKLDIYNKHKAECALLGRQFALSKGNSKAIPSQYIFKKDAADNSRQRANVHHAGSHYHMQMSRSMQFGRTKGLMARHSSQGSRLQASRMAASKAESQRMQSGGVSGMKIGKTSKKSNQKRQGKAGGSKKTGGNKDSGTGCD
jgi:hypothetical protein